MLPKDKHTRNSNNYYHNNYYHNNYSYYPFRTIILKYAFTIRKQALKNVF